MRPVVPLDVAAPLCLPPRVALLRRTLALRVHGELGKPPRDARATMTCALERSGAQLATSLGRKHAWSDFARWCCRRPRCRPRALWMWSRGWVPRPAECPQRRRTTVGLPSPRPVYRHTSRPPMCPLARLRGGMTGEGERERGGERRKRKAAHAISHESCMPRKHPPSKDFCPPPGHRHSRLTLVCCENNGVVGGLS